MILLPIVFLVVGLALSAHFASVRSVFGLYQRPGWRSEGEALALEARVKIHLESPSFPVVVSLGRSLGSILFALGGWNLLFFQHTPRWWSAAPAALVILVLLYLLGDFFPRLAARLKAERILPASLWLQGALGPLFLPAALPVVQLRRILERRLGWDGRFDFLTEHERAKLADAQQTAEVRMEREIIRAALDLGETRVREIMTPRLSVVALPLSASGEEAIALLRESRCSRLPVHDGGLDNVVGILHAKDLVGITEPWDLRSLLRPVVHVPESQLASDLLRTLRTGKHVLSVVVDEHGAVSGVATMEDVLEEIVGEIHDETDDESPAVRAVGGGQFLVRGDARLDEVASGLGREEPALPRPPEGAEADTLAGLMLCLCGSIPSLDAPQQFGRWEMTVLEMDGNRLSLIRLQRLAEPDQTSARATMAAEGQSVAAIPEGAPE